MKDDTEEWQSAGVILLVKRDNFEEIKIVTKDHTYEMQACRFVPLMEKFALRVDGKFNYTNYDSLDRILKLIEVSESSYCSEKEKDLEYKIEDLERIISNLEKEITILEREKCDLEMMLHD